MAHAVVIQHCYHGTCKMCGRHLVVRNVTTWCDRVQDEMVRGVCGPHCPRVLVDCNTRAYCFECMDAALALERL